MELQKLQLFSKFTVRFEYLTSIKVKLFISAPPKNAAISGPDIIHHNDEFTYECSIDGGNPTPEITWTLRDHLGQTKEMTHVIIVSRNPLPRPVWEEKEIFSFPDRSGN